MLTGLRDELEIMALLRSCECADVDANERRALVGAAQYGALRVDLDERDFVVEAVEEMVDARFYLAAEVIRLRRIMALHASQFTSAPKTSARIESHIGAIMSAVITIDATIRDITTSP